MKDIKGYETTDQVGSTNPLEEIRRLNEMSKKTERINPGDSLAWAQKANDLAALAEDVPGQIKSLLQIGRSQWLGGNLNQALQSLMKALEMVKETREHRLEVDILNALGNVNIYMRNYGRTLEYYGQALKLADAIGYDQMAAGILNNFGEVYKNLKDYSTALMYYHESLSRHDQMKGRYDESITMVNIGMVCCELGEFEEASFYAEESMKVNMNANYVVGEGYSRHLLGRISHRKGNLGKAVEEYKNSLDAMPDTSDVNLRIDLCRDLYHALNESGDREQALEYLFKGLEIAEDLETDSVTADFYSLIATQFEEEGEISKSNQYYKKYHDLTKKMTESEQESKLRSIAFQMEADEYAEKHRAYEILTEQLKAQTLNLEEKTDALALSNERMQIISEIGQKITATLNLKDIFEQIYRHTNSLMKADVLGVGVYRQDQHVLEYPYYMENGVKLAPFTIPVSSETSWAVWCLKNRRDVIVNDIEAEYSAYLKGYQSSSGDLMHSLLFCPLTVNDDTIGVITVQSRHKNTYESHHLDALRILASYAAIAINNARQSTELEAEIKSRQHAQRELEKLNQQLRNLSEIDGLTAVANRRKFDSFLEEEWERAKRDRIPLSLLLIDIDFFKEYNDFYGHVLGDQILKDVAATLQRTLKRSVDFISRYGGDEFIVVLHHTDKPGAMNMAGNMVEAVSALGIPHESTDLHQKLSITIGVTTLTPDPLDSMEILLQQSDEALYRAKKRGRNCAVHYSGD